MDGSGRIKSKGLCSFAGEEVLKIEQKEEDRRNKTGEWGGGG